MPTHAIQRLAALVGTHRSSNPRVLVRRMMDPGQGGPSAINTSAINTSAINTGLINTGLISRVVLRGSLLAGSLVLSLMLLAGCRSHQTARVVQPGHKEMIGSHKAGQEVYRPLVDQTVAALLGHFEEQPHMQLASAGGEPLPPPKLSICFVGVENKTSEEIGDFKEMLYELIDTRLLESTRFKPISRRYVQAGLDDLRLPPQQLFLPNNLQSFAHVMQQQGQPFEYLLFAKLTSGTTQDNRDYQRDYLLTLEMVDIRTGEQHKQSTPISKQYFHSWTSRVKSNLWPW